MLTITDRKLLSRSFAGGRSEPAPGSGSPRYASCAGATARARSRCSARSPSWPPRASSRPGRARARSRRRGPRPSRATSTGRSSRCPQGGASDPLVRLLSPPSPGTIPLAAGYLDEACCRSACWPRRQPGRAPAGRLEPAAARGARAAADLVRHGPRRPAARGRRARRGRRPGGLATAFRALAAPGDAVVVEAPTYVGATAAARSAGPARLPRAGRRRGLRPALLREALQRSGARLVYCQPLYANPHGTVLAEERRPAVLEAVADAGAFLVEDDWARDLVLRRPGAPAAGRRRPRRPRRLPPLAHQDRRAGPAGGGAGGPRPGVRPAALGAAGGRSARLRRAPRDRAEPGQRAVLRPPRAPGAGRAAPPARQASCPSLPPAARSCRSATCPAGGLHVWAELSAGQRRRADRRRGAAGRRAGRPPGRRTTRPRRPGPALRLSFAGAGADDLRDGVRRLAGVLEQL